MGVAIDMRASLSLTYNPYFGKANISTSLALPTYLATITYKDHISKTRRTKNNGLLVRYISDAHVLLI